MASPPTHLEKKNATQRRHDQRIQNNELKDKIWQLQTNPMSHITDSMTGEHVDLLIDMYPIFKQDGELLFERFSLDSDQNATDPATNQQGLQGTSTGKAPDTKTTPAKSTETPPTEGTETLSTYPTDSMPTDAEPTKHIDMTQDAKAAGDSVKDDKDEPQLLSPNETTTSIDPAKSEPAPLPNKETLATVLHAPLQLRNPEDNTCLTTTGLGKVSIVDAKPCTNWSKDLLFTYDFASNTVKPAHNSSFCLSYVNNIGDTAMLTKACNKKEKHLSNQFSLDEDGLLPLDKERCLSIFYSSDGVEASVEVLETCEPPVNFFATTPKDDPPAVKQDPSQPSTPEDQNTTDSATNQQDPQGPSNPGKKTEDATSKSTPAMSTETPPTETTEAPPTYSTDTVPTEPTDSTPTKPTPRSTTAKASGDPHFTRFGGERFDFHGGCDLVLVHAPEYSNGLGLTVHIRTKIQSWWSYIESAVLQIGTETLEVQGSKSSGARYWINGKEASKPQDRESFEFAGHQVLFRQVTEKKNRFRVSLGHRDAIALETFNTWVNVNVGAKGHSFEGASGLLGSFPNGEKLARDGVTVVEDDNAFGKEWQVQLTEDMLFHDLGDGVHHPQGCSMPSKKTTKKRRLGEARITKEQAEKACSGAKEEERKACMFDVMAVNDIGLAQMYAI